MEQLHEWNAQACRKRQRRVSEEVRVLIVSTLKATVTIGAGVSIGDGKRGQMLEADAKAKAMASRP